MMSVSKNMNIGIDQNSLTKFLSSPVEEEMDVDETDEKDDSYDLFLPSRLSQRALMAIDGTEDKSNSSPYFEDENGKVLQPAIENTSKAIDKKLSTVPLLLRRTEDERDKILNDKVALVLMNDSSNKENSSEEIKLESGHLKCNFDGETKIIMDNDAKIEPGELSDELITQNETKIYSQSDKKSDNGSTLTISASGNSIEPMFFTLSTKVLNVLADQLQNLHKVSELYVINVSCNDGCLEVHSNILQVRCPNAMNDVNDKKLILQHSLNVCKLFFYYINCGRIDKFQNISIDTRLSLTSLCDKYGMLLLKEVLSFNWIQALDLCPVSSSNCTEEVLAKYIQPSPVQSPQYQRYDEFEYNEIKNEAIKVEYKETQETDFNKSIDLDSFFADYEKYFSPVKFDKKQTITVDSDSDDCIVVSTTKATTVIDDSDNSDVEVIAVVPSNQNSKTSPSILQPETRKRKHSSPMSDNGVDLVLPKTQNISPLIGRSTSLLGPQYSKMPDDQLKKELIRYKINRNLPREKALKLLPFVYEQAHKANISFTESSKRTTKKRKRRAPSSPQPSTSSAPDPEYFSASDSSKDSGDSDAENTINTQNQPKLCIMRALIKLMFTEKSKIYESVLLYRPIKISKFKTILTEFYEARISKSVLKQVLDEYGILYRRSTTKSPKKKRKHKI